MRTLLIGLFFLIAIPMSASAQIEPDNPDVYDNSCITAENPYPCDWSEDNPEPTGSSPVRGRGRRDELHAMLFPLLLLME